MAGDEDGGTLALGLYFAFWFLGNNFYNIQNKRALNATGGKHAGFGMTVATLQLGVGTIYSFFVWIVGYNLLPVVGFVKPSRQKPPQMSMGDVMKMIPVAFCSAAAHSSSVLALNAGSVTFGQIVKAAEPVFSAVVATFMYGKKISLIKWLTLPVIVGGVIFSSFKPLPMCAPKMKVQCASEGTLFPYMIEVDMTALIMASIANFFAAIKGNENSKLLSSDPELKKRIGGVGNQFAMTEVLGFFISLPLMFYLEGANFSKFVNMATTDSVLSYNLVASGMTFYLYNELATMTIKKTSAVTASVANTAKRVIVMVVSAIVFGEVMTFEAKVGAFVAILGVFLNSTLDDLLKPKAKEAGKKL
jgi:solute carrier family 35 protein E1